MPRRNRRTSLDRIRDAGFDAVADGVDPASRPRDGQYIISLTDDAAQDAGEFAAISVLAQQLDNWEREVFAGHIAPAQPLAPITAQELLYELINLTQAVIMVIGGGCTIADATSYPAALELITVAEANTLSLPGVISGAADTDIFIIVHVENPLADALYGVDIAHVTNHSGQIVVQDGKVRYDHPAPLLSLTYNGNPVGDCASTLITDAAGDHPQTFIPIPQISGGPPPPGYTYIDVPQNCCNGGAQPPNVPPTIPPTIDPTLPTPPTPVGVTTVDIACSEIFSQAGASFDFWSDLVSFGAKVYGNRPGASTQYPVGIGGGIHDWIVANVPAFRFSCDRLLSVTMLLHMTHTDPRIFGVISNPFGSNTVTPRIDNYRNLGGSVFKHDPIYFFQPDGTKQLFLGPVDIIVNRYTKFIYETSHKITVRDEDRLNGNVGIEDWAFYVDESDVSDAASMDPLSLQVCGIQYKAHQHIDTWAFDGSDEVRTISGTHYLYGKYGNGRIAYDPSTFTGDGLDVFSDGLHPGNFLIDWICDLTTPGTNGVVTGQVTQVDYPGEVGDRIHLYVPGVVDPTISNYVDIAHDAVKAGFSCILTTAFPAFIGPYGFNVGNDGSHHMKFYNVTAYIS